MIGEAPGRGGDPSRACTGRFMDALVNAAGITRWRYLRAFERTNLLPSWPGKAGKGDAFPMAEAKRLAAETPTAGRTILLCGRRVATAFGVSAPFLACERRGGATFWVLPHPSGLNRWWNDPENKRRAGDLVRDLARPERSTVRRKKSTSSF
jgi:hypothetical protein